uniref:Uncharacterized protein n=1 Tax=Palpitomonas bilix TaxID=652834 RepID=A0A7S3GAX3_9EUKA|mmetsp:Transcript_36773/g.95228  ORF Transcript_36773/g.95228 Transcript_36773/m.95228 type:complete len:105 (+) Transcript_36773:207-521(+)
MTAEITPAPTSSPAHYHLVASVGHASINAEQRATSAKSLHTHTKGRWETTRFFSLHTNLHPHQAFYSTPPFASISISPFKLATLNKSSTSKKGKKMNRQDSRHR